MSNSKKQAKYPNILQLDPVQYEVELMNGEDGTIHIFKSESSLEVCLWPKEARAMAKWLNQWADARQKQMDNDNEK